MVSGTGRGGGGAGGGGRLPTTKHYCAYGLRTQELQLMSWVRLCALVPVPSWHKATKLSSMSSILIVTTSLKKMTLMHGVRNTKTRKLPICP